MTGRDPTHEPSPTSRRSPWLAYQTALLRAMPTADELYRQRAAALREPAPTKVSIVTPLYETPPDGLRRMLASVRRQSYPWWEHCVVDDGSSASWIPRALERAAAADGRVRFRRRDTNGGIVAASNDALAMASGDLVAFLDHDDVLEPDALHHVVEAFRRRPDTDVVYTDLDIVDLRGSRVGPLLFPDWSPELLWTTPYVVHLAVYRRTLVEALGGLRPGLDGAQDYDLALRASERTDRIVHVPRVLYRWTMAPGSSSVDAEAKPYAKAARRRAVGEHLERRGLDAAVVDSWVAVHHAVRFALSGRPRVTVIVAVAEGTDPDPALLGDAEGWDAEIVLVGPSSLLSGGARRLARGFEEPVRTVAVDGDLTAAWNAAAATARGDHLLFVERSLVPVTGDWVRAMLEYSQQAGIGVVGAKILSPDASIDEVGVVLPRGIPHRAFHGASSAEVGPFALLEVPRNVSAVSGACLMTPRDTFGRLGGFRSRAEVGFPAIDYCLRLRGLGDRVVVTPHAVVRRREGSLAALAADADAVAAFRRGAPACPDGDPYYNPGYFQGDGSFRLADE